MKTLAQLRTRFKQLVGNSGVNNTIVDQYINDKYVDSAILLDMTNQDFDLRTITAYTTQMDSNGTFIEIPTTLSKYELKDNIMLSEYKNGSNRKIYLKHNFGSQIVIGYPALTELTSDTDETVFSINTIDELIVMYSAIERLNDNRKFEDATQLEKRKNQLEAKLVQANAPDFIDGFNDSDEQITSINF